LAIPYGTAATLGSLVLLVAGLLIVFLLAPPWLSPGERAAPSAGEFSATQAGQAMGRVMWTRAARTGLAAGILPALAWTVTSGPGWGARLALLVGAGLWVVSACMGSEAELQTARRATPVAFLALTFMIGLGYATSAGILFYLGPPLALVVLMAGQAASEASKAAMGSPRLTRSGGLGHDLTGIAYVMAAVVMALLAFIDLL
jgi:hypothetical protein